MFQRGLVPVADKPVVNFDRQLAQARLMAESGFFPDSRAVAQAFVKVQAGAELGFGPFASMSGIFVLKGKIAVSAMLMAAAIRRSGRYDYRTKRHDDQACVIEFYLDGESIGESSFTMEDAKRAGLAGGDNWRKYPRNMLFARALSNGARWFCPDLFVGGVYTPDELGAEVDGESGEVTIVTPATSVREIVPVRDDELEGLAARKGADVVKILAHYGVGSLSELTAGQKNEVVGNLNARPDVSTPTGTAPVGEENSVEDVEE